MHQKEAHSFEPGELSAADFHQAMLACVAPRPIAFVSTIDKEGRVNLSPFSYFGVFGINPGTLIFSPAKRVRDTTLKHSLENVLEVPECVVNMVNYPMIEQMSLASCEYPKGVNEFVKAGFTEVSSDIVKPPRVGESPASFECKVLEVKEMGQSGGSGNLVICEVLKVHVGKSFLKNGKVDTTSLDLVARMGGDWYARASGSAVFQVAKPNLNMGMGFDKLPDFVKHSPYLSGNDLGKLANATSFPSEEEKEVFRKSSLFGTFQVLMKTAADKESLRKDGHHLAKGLLLEGRVNDAWALLLELNL